MDSKAVPWGHQKKAFDRASGVTNFALFFEQGCGKTRTLLDILCDKYAKAGGVFSTLIFCPPIVVRNWKREIKKFTDINPDQVLCLFGSQIQRISDLKEFLTVSKGCGIVITNYEAVLMTELLRMLTSFSPKAVILDESHKCKDLAAKRTKTVIKLSKTAEFRFILSGTPIVNGYLDLFSQFLFLDSGETFGKSYWDFRRNYYTDLNAMRPRSGYFPNWVPKAGTGLKISQAISHKAMRVKKSECLDLPPLVRQIVEFELSSEQRKVYLEMERDFLTVFNNTVFSADLVIKKAIRLHQITSGFLADDTKTIHKFTPNPRIAALKEIIANISQEHKFIIWCVFKQNYLDIKALLEDLKIGNVELHGGVKPSSRQAIVDVFNDPKSQVRAMIANPQAGGVGINLTQASYAVFYSHGFSLEADLQAEARNHRGGSEIHEKITRIDLAASQTIDGVILSALRDKCNISESVLNYMKGKTNGSTNYN